MFADKATIRLGTRKARHQRIRKKIEGTAERPRLCVRRSLNQIYVQIVDDGTGRSLVQVSSLSPELKSAIDGKNKVETSKAVGKLVAQKALAAGIKNVVFDRGGYLFHGRIEAVAVGAREGGLEF